MAAVMTSAIAYVRSLIVRGDTTGSIIALPPFHAGAKRCPCECSDKPQWNNKTIRKDKNGSSNRQLFRSRTNPRTHRYKRYDECEGKPDKKPYGTGVHIKKAKVHRWKQRLSRSNAHVFLRAALSQLPDHLEKKQNAGENRKSRKRQNQKSEITEF